ncbi:hypothetical protein SAMN04490248_12721 [Salinihabitans flavidus]|uniref:DUF2059 domain-containing protein n=1 Tax=Salinihabitans flavidus TaxID=569882 RepID=A0A1H8VAX0_9RHOB|nr:DUF2059 domain-containing protein [Salinihabitans flavidus]SEP12622.1 hypothetical protein SAMN04490248_12721 [Salinihabitans flavidus]
MSLPIYRFIAVFACIVLTICTSTLEARADGRDRLEGFLEVTGFDVALGSIADAAGEAPEMLGLPDNAFGADWTRLSEEVFDREVMLDRALDILDATLEDDLLEHASQFYGGALGRRLVQAENRAHRADDRTIRIEGQEIVDRLREENPARLAYYERMNHAIDPEGIAVRALQEVQIRFLMAAAASGVVQLRLDEEGLRAMMAENEEALREQMAASALRSAAYTYRDFSDDEILTYTEALEHPDMQTVYELMNAVHYEIMTNRFEVLAHRMGELHPGQDL